MSQKEIQKALNHYTPMTPRSRKYMGAKRRKKRDRRILAIGSEISREITTTYLGILKGMSKINSLPLPALISKK